jgi:hypothetical protein
MKLYRKKNSVRPKAGIGVQFTMLNRYGNIIDRLRSAEIDV